MPKNQFQGMVNDIVVYGTNGVCKITEIEEKNLMGTNKTFLVLKPLDDDRSTYYIPTDNKNQLDRLRKILTKDEINKLIDSMAGEKVLWIENERERKECYSKIIAEGNHSDLIRIIKAIFLKKKEREGTGKKLHISDERFLRDAEKVLYGEFRYVLELSEQDLMSYIFARIEKSN